MAIFTTHCYNFRSFKNEEILYTEYSDDDVDDQDRYGSFGRDLMNSNEIGHYNLLERSGVNNSDEEESSDDESEGISLRSDSLGHLDDTVR